MKRMVLSLAVAMMSLLVALPAWAADPAEKPDHTWLTVSGTVEEVRPNAFTLDYGEGSITVEMDDGDRDADAYKLLRGDRVTVSGMIDDGLWENKTIEAASVFVEKLSTTFYASAADEEDRMVPMEVRVVVSETELRGEVTSIVDENEFMLDTGMREILVETDAMPYNPLDEEGYQKIEVGDYVSVMGRMDNDLFEGREFVAESVVTLLD